MLHHGVSMDDVADGVGDAMLIIWWHRSGSTLAQIMTCCLTAPSHYLNQCWLIISEVFLHSPGAFLQEIITISGPESLGITDLRLYLHLPGAHELIPVCSDATPRGQYGWYCWWCGRWYANHMVMAVWGISHYLISLTHWGSDKMVDTLQMTFSNAFSLIKISLNFVPKGPIDNNSSLVQVMAWQKTCDMQLPEPMMTMFNDAYMHQWYSMS